MRPNASSRSRTVLELVGEERLGELAEVLAGAKHTPRAQPALVRDREHAREHAVEVIALLALEHDRLARLDVLALHTARELRERLTRKLGQQADAVELVDGGWIEPRHLLLLVVELVRIDALLGLFLRLALGRLLLLLVGRRGLIRHGSIVARRARAESVEVLSSLQRGAHGRGRQARRVPGVRLSRLGELEADRMCSRRGGRRQRAPSAPRRRAVPRPLGPPRRIPRRRRAPA